MGAMVPLLAALLLSASPEPSQSPIRGEGAPAVEVRTLAGSADVVGLCRRLVPAERLRPAGDAVDQGEAWSRQEAGRDESLGGRYRITIPGARLAFAPYDGPERRLSVAEPATLRLDGGAVVLTALEARDLPVHVNAAMARRILAARAAGRLQLELVFDLPDDAICGQDRSGRRYRLGVEPVEWSWRDGQELLSRGGVSDDRPAVSAAVGAEPAIDVGEPIAGPPEARKAVLGHRNDLAVCYAEELRRDPGADGVVVVDLGARVGVSADSTGSAALTSCVERALAPLAGSARASVPIRFELATPSDARKLEAAEKKHPAEPAEAE